jgi:hypothetical protein
MTDSPPDEDPDTATEAADSASTNGAQNADSEADESDREYGVVQEDAPDSIEEIDAPEAAQAHSEPAPDPLAGIASPDRETAPQSRFDTRAVAIGCAVFLVGLSIAFVAPAVVAG